MLAPQPNRDATEEPFRRHGVGIATYEHFIRMRTTGYRTGKVGGLAYSDPFPNRD